MVCTVPSGNIWIQLPLLSCSTQKSIVFWKTPSPLHRGITRPRVKKNVKNGLVKTISSAAGVQRRYEGLKMNFHFNIPENEVLFKNKVEIKSVDYIKKFCNVLLKRYNYW